MAINLGKKAGQKQRALWAAIFICACSGVFGSVAGIFLGEASIIKTSFVVALIGIIAGLLLLARQDAKA